MTKKDQHPGSVESIYNKIVNAIVERRLSPGERLIEEKMSKIFGVGRSKIREVIQKLVQNGFAVHIPNRGALIYKPTKKKAQEVFYIRRILESEIIKIAVEKATEDDIQLLRKHLQLQRQSRDSENKFEPIRLSGEFHDEIARISGNETACQLLKELEVITSLVIMLYSRSSTSMTCPEEDHPKLVQAIENRDSELAAMLMRKHIHHIEQNLNFVDGARNLKTLEDIFQ